MRTICVIGLGYIGLPTALLLARAGYNVVGVDIDEKKIKTLNNGALPFKEAGMAELFAEAKERFSAARAPVEADTYIICVPTPVTAMATCDDSFVRSATESIVPMLRPAATVILESTVVPGTTTGLVKKIIESSGYVVGRDILLGFVSEKAIPGNTIYEMINNDRIVAGVDTASAERIKELYGAFVRGGMYVTDCATAEAVKLVENSYRDLNIAFANELSGLCDTLGINVWEVIRLANRHPRVNVHAPGPGVGGHCIALDPYFLRQKDESHTRLIGLARQINEGQPIAVAEAVAKLAIKYQIKTVGILGVAYKKNVDDARETPAIPLIQALQAKGLEVLIHDPLVTSFPGNIQSRVQFLEHTEALVVVTDHDIFQDIVPGPRCRFVYDTRAQFEQKRQFDCHYYLLGSLT